MAEREIKFRLWADGEMVYCKPFRLVPPSESIYGSIVYMQWTGLYDRRRKEIYEGDIVQTTTNQGDVVSVGDVQFSHGVFGAEWARNKKHKDMVGSFGQLHNLKSMDDKIIERLEVIGNIYENPELLNKEQTVQECDATDL